MACNTKQNKQTDKNFGGGVFMTKQFFFQASYYCSLQGSHLDKTDNDFPPLASTWYYANQPTEIKFKGQHWLP